MARYYLDSSALVKRYHAEQGTTDVDALFHTPGNRLFISRLALVERSLDVLHLATTVALQRRSKVAGFAAADKRLLAVAAQACGLTPIPVG